MKTSIGSGIICKHCKKNVIKNWISRNQKNLDKIGKNSIIISNNSYRRINMKKRVISLVLALTFVFASVFASNAATSNQGATVGSITTKNPTAISYKDISRLAELATTVRGKQAKIVNATKYNGSNTTWIVRLNFGDGGDQCAADFVITCLPYSWDSVKLQPTSLPFGNVEEGTAMYGPCWYYFGLFDDVNHNSCGFAIAERIKRWPDWDDLTFSGVTYRGVGYSGSYLEANDQAFIEKHIQ